MSSLRLAPQDPGMAATLGASPALAVAKQQLRAQMKQQLKSLPAAAVASQSATIFGALSRFRPFIDARRVAVFLSMPAAEVQTDAIVRHALAVGKQVFVPYLHKTPHALLSDEAAYCPPRVMDMVQLRDVADYEALGRDRWGIPSVDAATVHTRRRILDGEPTHEPTQQTEESESAKEPLDIILMPGVAFDVDPATNRIHRCGHGRGFYDYFLHRYALKMASTSPSSSSSSSSSPNSVRLYGLALVEQVLPAQSVPTGPHDQPLDGLIAGDGSVVVPDGAGHKHSF